MQRHMGGRSLTHPTTQCRVSAPSSHSIILLCSSHTSVLRMRVKRRCMRATMRHEQHGNRLCGVVLGSDPPAAVDESCCKASPSMLCRIPAVECVRHLQSESNAADCLRWHYTIPIQRLQARE